MDNVYKDNEVPVDLALANADPVDMTPVDAAFSCAAPADAVPDCMLTIAYASNCRSVKWINKTVSFDELCNKLGTTVRTPETVSEYASMKGKQRTDAKDTGCFVGGFLKDGLRRRENVLTRSMLAMDLDKAESGFADKYTEGFAYASCLYSTHSHTPEQPRLRLIVPLSRDVSLDEYQAIGRYLAYEWGIEQFDACSYNPVQAMFWPSTPSDGEFIFKRTGGPWLDPDAFLDEHPGWRDCANLPVSKREKEARTFSHKKAADPLEKPGIVGAFCREYGISEAVDAFLPDIYEEVSKDRYRYRPSDSAPGVIVYDDKFAYSHHASDPASERNLNAFDLVRIHKFGDEDEKKSYQQMCDFARGLERVRRCLQDEKWEEVQEAFADEDWERHLERNKSGAVVNSLFNLQLILMNDQNLKGIVYNELADSLEIRTDIADVPWKHPSRFWRDADDAQLACYIAGRYGSFSKRNHDVALIKIADDRSCHPIRDYFASLPAWDKTGRVETLLIDYLGAQDNAYVRAVTKKSLCAAYRRVYEPGVKFDSMIVLCGAQGIGKSTLIAALGMEWFSDSLSLSDMNDKTSAEKLQGYWILEIGELAGMRKADIDRVKAFFSRQDDKFRPAFGRRVTPHPRQCIFFGTTNNENGYLRDITGNRRFWNVRVSGNGRYKPWALDPETVAQIWAEVRTIAQAGEKLYLDTELEEYARMEQRRAMECDEREGMVREYLDMLLPPDWDEMNLENRRNYFQNKLSGEEALVPMEEGVRCREFVCNMEIWCECFGRNREDMRKTDSYAIAAIMERIEGWEKAAETDMPRISIYGKQRGYRRRKESREEPAAAAGRKAENRSSEDECDTMDECAGHGVSDSKRITSEHTGSQVPEGLDDPCAAGR